jgi:hypothetical protein
MPVVVAEPLFGKKMAIRQSHLLNVKCRQTLRAVAFFALAPKSLLTDGSRATTEPCNPFCFHYSISVQTARAASARALASSFCAGRGATCEFNCVYCCSDCNGTATQQTMQQRDLLALKKQGVDLLCSYSTVHVSKNYRLPRACVTVSPDEKTSMTELVLPHGLQPSYAHLTKPC